MPFSLEGGYVSQVSVPVERLEEFSPDETLAELARWLPDLHASALPAFRRALVEAGSYCGGLREGCVSLFDYAFNVVVVLDVREGRPLHIFDYQSSSLDAPGGIIAKAADRDLRSGKAASPARSESLIALPLRSGSRDLALLCLITPGTKLQVSAAQRSHLEALCALGAVAFERAEQELRFQPEESWLTALTSVFTAAREANDIKPLLATVADSVLKVSQADFVVLYEYFEESKDVALPPIFKGDVREQGVIEQRGIAKRHEDSVLFRLIQREKPFFAEDAPEEWESYGLASRLHPDQRSFFEREGVVSSAGIPLRPAAGGETVGVLFVNYRSRVPFLPDFQEKLALVAGQAALAIGNMRFLLRANQANRHLRAIRRIGSELGEAVSRSIQEIGALIDERTQEILDTKNLFLCLYRKEGDREIFSLPYLRDDVDTKETIEPRLSRGLAAYVCRSGRPQFLSAEDQKKLFVKGEAELVGTASAIWMGSPLIARGRVIGALVAQDYDRKDAFDRGQCAVLEDVASQAAIAIDNYDLLRQERERSEELRIFLDLSEAFARRDLSATQLLSRILDYLCEVAEVTGSLLLLRFHDRRKGDFLRIVATSRSLRDQLNQEVPWGSGVSGRVMNHGQPVIVGDYPNWEDPLPFLDPLPEQVCAVPLLLGDELIGVVTLSSDSQDPKLGKRELEILKRFAGPAAIAVRNARDASFRETLIEAGPHAIVALDSHGIVSNFNDEAERLFGYEADQIVGRNVETLYWDADEAHLVGDELHAKGRAEEEIFGRTNDGKKIPLLLAGSVLRDETGAVLGSVGILEDQRLQSLRGRTKRVVRAMQEIDAGDDLEAVLRTTVECSVPLLYAEAGALFLHEDESLHFRYGTKETGSPENFDARAAANYLLSRFGLGLQETRYLEADELGPLQLRSDAASSVVIPLLTESRLIGYVILESPEPRHFKADGELIEILASQAAVSINRIQLLLYRQHTQRELLVAANAILVGQIGTSFLHEAKNSLNAMSLSLLDLQQSLESEQDLRAKDGYVEQIQELRDEVQRFDLLSRRLQRFTKEGLRPEKKWCYLNAVIEQSTRLMRSALESRGMKLHVKLDPSLDLPSGGKGGNPVEIDEAQIQQVLMNLILNAMAASPDRGPLHVESHNLGERAEIRVTDHGSGIPEEVRPKLFNPFFSTKPDGVGLGLYLSRLLIQENHQGTIEIVQSAPGRGTTFAVILPRRSSRKSKEQS